MIRLPIFCGGVISDPVLKIYYYIIWGWSGDSALRELPYVCVRSLKGARVRAQFQELSSELCGGLSFDPWALTHAEKLCLRHTIARRHTREDTLAHTRVDTDASAYTHTHKHAHTATA